MHNPATTAERGANALDAAFSRARAKVAAASSNALAPKQLREFLAEKIVVDELIGGMLRRGWVYAMTANTGHGKTGVAVPLTLSVQNGLRVAGFQCERGNTLYIAGENPDDVRGRFAAAVDQMGIRVGPESVLIIDRTLLLAERIAELCQIIEMHDIVFVVVDTDQAVSLGSGSDEINNSERMAHAKLLRQLTRAKSNPTILDLCHPRARAGKDELVPRGGSAFLNEIDGNLRLWRDGEVAEVWSDPNKFRGRPVTLAYRLELVETDLVRDKHGKPVPVPFFRAIDDVEAATVADAQWRDENRLIFAIDTKPSATQAEWATACAWFSEDGKPRKDKVNRLLQVLAKASPALVMKGRSGRWTLTKAGKDEAAKS